MNQLLGGIWRLRRRRLRSSSDRRSPRHRCVGFESLESRRLLAVLTNGIGDGMVSLEVNEQGAFGRSPNLDVNTGIPEDNAVSDAIYNPVGEDFGPGGTTYTSGLAIGFNIGTDDAFREFLTAGTIANTGNNVNGLFSDQFQTDLQRTSTFFYPNEVVEPEDALLRFDLTQSLVDLSFQGTQSGTSLIQEYTITNVSGTPLSFDLVRYWDGDLFEEGGAGNDGGGKDIFEVTRQLERVFMTATATGTQLNDPTFITVQNSPDTPGVPPLPRDNRWEVFASASTPDKETNELLTRIVGGDELRNDVIPEANDASPVNDIVDFGRGDDYAVALRNVFEDVLAPFVYTIETQFGNPRIGNPPPLPPTRITGVKWADLDGNGTQDAGEPTVSGWRIFLDDNNDGILDGGERSTVTDAGGSYNFNVDPGDYFVSEVQQANWTQTFPTTTSHELTLGVGDTGIADFGNDPAPGSIQGVKWNDENNNQVRDAGEPGLAGWTIYLDDDNNGVLDPGESSVVTGSGGAYEFPTVEFGTHVVREVPQADFSQTFPAANGGHSVFVGAGQIVTGVSFGNRLKDGFISGTKFDDLDADGIRDPDEPGVGDFVIYADVDNDGEIGLGEPAAITQSDGTYMLPPMRPGTYVIREESRPGWVQTFPGGDGGNTAVVDPGVTTTGVDFGNRRAFDFGDAPDPYPTLLGDDGAAHGFTDEIFLGAVIDFEPNGQPETFALGDDLAEMDDEDGVAFLTDLLPGQVADVEITASDDGVLAAWIDFNNDEDWADAGENVFSDVILQPGVNELSFAVPAAAMEGPTFARFRFSQQFDLSFTGTAQTGEVEDYRVFVGEPPSLGEPEAVDDPFTVGANSTDNVLNVLVNDTVPAGGTASIAATGPTSNGGTVTIASGNTSLLYTPAAGFVGVEAFTYTLVDGLGGIDQAIVTVQVVALSDTPFHNPLNPLDVSGDTFVSPIDALLVINDLNSNGARQLPRSAGAPGAPTGMVDVNGDNFVSPIDALYVINHLNETAAGGGEGEAAALAADSAPTAVLAAGRTEAIGVSPLLLRDLHQPTDDSEPSSARIESADANLQTDALLRAAAVDQLLAAADVAASEEAFAFASASASASSPAAAERLTPLSLEPPHIDIATDVAQALGDALASRR